MKIDLKIVSYKLSLVMEQDSLEQIASLLRLMLLGSTSKNTEVLFPLKKKKKKKLFLTKNTLFGVLEHEGVDKIMLLCETLGTVF